MLRILLALFIVVPLAELAIFMALGRHLGLINTVAIILLTAVLGASLTKSQGMKALRSFQNATAEGKIPHQEIIEGLLILIAGAVLLTPGFLTDAIGFLLLIPPSRAAICKVVAKVAGDRIKVSTFGAPPAETETQTNPQSNSGPVIDV